MNCVLFCPGPMVWQKRYLKQYPSDTFVGTIQSRKFSSPSPGMWRDVYSKLFARGQQTRGDNLVIMSKESIYIYFAVYIYILPYCTYMCQTLWRSKVWNMIYIYILMFHTVPRRYWVLPAVDDLLAGFSNFFGVLDGVCYLQLMEESFFLRRSGIFRFEPKKVLESVSFLWFLFLLASVFQRFLFFSLVFLSSVFFGGSDLRFVGLNPKNYWI